MHEIFNYFISRDKDSDKKRLAYMSWFCTSFPLQEFRNEEAIFVHFMQYVTKLGLPLKEKYFQIYLDSEVKKFIVEKGIKISGIETYNFEEPTALATAINIVKDTMLAEFREMEAEQADAEDFAIIADQFMKSRMNERMVEVFEKAYIIISEKGDSTDSIEYSRESIALLSDIYDITKLEEVVDIVETSGEMGDMTFLVDSGLPAIDKVVGGLRRKQLMGIEAPPGAGKTRMALGVYAHRASVLYHLNCVYFALEQTKKEVEAMLTARHVLYMFEKLVSDKMITEGKVPKDLQPLVDAAKLDLFESGKYGKIEIIETNLYVEDFVEKMRNQDRLKGPFDIFVIDHLYLVESKATGYNKLTEAQIIKLAYRRFKRFVRTYVRGGIAVNQFNSSGIEASKADKDIDATMIAGGIEAYRNTDFDIAITYTDVMQAQGKRRLHIPKSRSSEPFASIIVDTRLGSCYWQQMKAREL